MTQHRVHVVGAAIAAIVLGSTGCQSQNDGSVGVEHNELGITEVEIDHGSIHGERLLTLRGLDQTGDTVATVTLRTGMVMYGADMPEQWNAGTEMIITAGEANATYVSPDRVPHAEVEPVDARLADFVRLTAVSAAIADEAKIHFTTRSPAGDGEVAFTAQNCNGANFPTANGSPSSCCQDGTDIWHKIAAGANINKLAWRTAGTACTDSSGAGGCTGTNCTYGPCGAKINVVSGTNTTAATVFTPTSAPTQCGRDGNGSAAGGAYEAPEAYTSQSLKPGVTASCAYDDCTETGPVSSSTGYWMTLSVYCDGMASGSLILYGPNNFSHTVSCSGGPNSERFWVPDAGTKYVVWSSNDTFGGYYGGGCSGFVSCSAVWTTDTEVGGSFNSDCSC